MDLPSVKTPALAVLRVLRANGHDDMAKMLVETIGALDEPDTVESALAQLIQYTHTKWLGDVNVDMDWRDWFRLLDELHAACHRELARRRVRHAPPDTAE